MHMTDHHPSQTVVLQHQQQQQQQQRQGVQTVQQQPQQMRQLCSSFNGSAGRSTGWIQLCCGIGSILVAIAQIIVKSSLSVLGYGIWGSVLFYIPAGILGIASANKNPCVIIGYMVMSILSAMSALGMLSIGIMGAGISSNYYYCEISYSDSDCEKTIMDAQVSAGSILSILGFIEFIVAIVGSAFCCAPASQYGQPLTYNQALQVHNPQPTSAYSESGYQPLIPYNTSRQVAVPATNH
ncbi:uncharacterized protein [Diadema setosum]|uniref:uncharacterized protein n=1 Tax=Diadema setosum TaxID=31175 RepID=UPI003B3A63E5